MNNPKRQWHKTLILSACLVFMMAVASAQTSYTIQNLGVLAGTDQSDASDVNNKGEVIGSCQLTVGSDNVAFYWSEETGMIALPGVGNDVKSTLGSAINNAGICVGLQTFQSNSDRAGLIWTRPIVSVIPDYLGENPGLIHVSARDINQNGAILTTTDVNGNLTAATIYQNGQHQSLGVFGTDTHSVGIKLNNLNRAIVRSTGPGGDHWVFWNGSSLINVGSLGGAFVGMFDLNDSNVIVGATYLAGNTVQRACYWEPPNPFPVDIGTLGGNTSIANAINNHGVIVGLSNLEDNTTINPFIYRDGTMDNLLDFLPPGTTDDWSIIVPESISDTGYITGFGYYQGSLVRAFLMTPHPLPGSVADYQFDGEAEGWVAVTDIPPFEPGVSSTPPSALGISPGGGFPVFAFWQSPEITVEQGKTYRARFTLTSTALASDNVPQFRLRVFQTSNNLAWFTAADSVDGQPPAAGEVQTYDVVFTPDVAGATGTVRLYLDLTHFNPLDDATATVILQEVIVEEVTVE